MQHSVPLSLRNQDGFSFLNEVQVLFGVVFFEVFRSGDAFVGASLQVVLFLDVFGTDHVLEHVVHDQNVDILDQRVFLVVALQLMQSVELAEERFLVLGQVGVVLGKDPKQKIEFLLSDGLDHVLAVRGVEKKRAAFPRGGLSEQNSESLDECVIECIYADRAKVLVLHNTELLADPVEDMRGVVLEFTLLELVVKNGLHFQLVLHFEVECVYHVVSVDSQNDAGLLDPRNQVADDFPLFGKLERIRLLVMVQGLFLGVLNEAVRELLVKFKVVLGLLEILRYLFLKSPGLIFDLFD